jgi:hypothetical protein
MSEEEKEAERVTKIVSKKIKAPGAGLTAEKIKELKETTVYNLICAANIEADLDADDETKDEGIQCHAAAIAALRELGYEPGDAATKVSSVQQLLVNHFRGEKYLTDDEGEGGRRRIKSKTLRRRRHRRRFGKKTIKRRR